MSLLPSIIALAPQGGPTGHGVGGGLDAFSLFAGNKYSPHDFFHSLPSNQKDRALRRAPFGPGQSVFTMSDAEDELSLSLPEGAAAEGPPVPPPRPPASLYKQNTWSPDTFRDEAWRRRKGNHGIRVRERSKSVTDEDLDELKGCIELGFGFDSPTMDKRLSDAFPAYELFYAVNNRYNNSVSNPQSVSSNLSDYPAPSPSGSSHAIFGPGENPQAVKTRLRQWAQVVAYSVRQSSV
nr:uncharacterized protein LOC109180423 [Ipomoea batatas]